ncbi:hypothetical protein JAAARDRAFT_189991 [Jaapia argillacea MUCL 33604]|uniref:Uncharacterized protein n=1 Tax=Jaapia argillacea MUCL 33604 TaxID=933084 RepID=A0A067Q946_9AGAM|nr:hypothetical protein JAAARDRAFT_189991 [Jaapia argillacea MUCL 33604]
MSPLFSIGVSASPIGRATSSEQPLPNIVSNFQDLSAILSLLASDTVEGKISDPETADWERMTSVWSLFGLVGAIRAYTKVFVGLAGAEAAGIDLAGAGAYTSKKTKEAMSCWAIGSNTSENSWQDDRHMLLGAIGTKSSQWKRPHIVVMGYVHCPFGGIEAAKEVVAWVLFGLLTVAITCVPVAVLRRTVAGTMWDNIALGMWAISSTLGGCFLPMLLQRLNPVGVIHVRDNSPDRFVLLDETTSQIDVITQGPPTEEIVNQLSHRPGSKRRSTSVNDEKGGKCLDRFASADDETASRVDFAPYGSSMDEIRNQLPEPCDQSSAYDDIEKGSLEDTSLGDSPIDESDRELPYGDEPKPDTDLHVLRDGDTVITSAQHSYSTIMWQLPHHRKPIRSGDRLPIRLLAATVTGTTLVAYIVNYFVLGQVETWRSYAWLGIQVVILTSRFILWALRPNLLPRRCRGNASLRVEGLLTRKRSLDVAREREGNEWETALCTRFNRVQV